MKLNIFSDLGKPGLVPGKCLSQCQLFKTELQYMGNTIFTESRHVHVKLLRSRLEAIQKLKPPVTPKDAKALPDHKQKM